MLFLFKKNNKKDRKITDGSKENRIQKLDATNLWLRYKCAQWLERKTADLTRKSWIIILICFTLFTSGYTIYVLVNSFSRTATNSITIIPIAKPINVLQIGKEMNNNNLTISRTEFEKIILFRRYMDSLGQSPTGKKVKDSIKRYRPGLLDSLTIVENQYHSQFKN